MDSRVLDELKMALNNGDCENEKHNRILAICGQYEGDERLLCNAVLEFISDVWLPRSIDKNMRIDYEGSENESVYGGLCDILKVSSCLLFNAMCAESMFLKTHKIEFAELSLSAYLGELECAKHEKEYTRITDVSVAICRLIIKLQNTQFDFPAFLDSECAYIRENLTGMSDLTVYVLEALAKCCDAVYNLGMNIVVSFAKNCVESFESDENTELQIRYLCFLKKIFKKRNDMQQLRATTKQLALAYERDAFRREAKGFRDSVFTINSVKHAILEWKELKDHANVARLSRKLDILQESNADAMTEFQTDPIDISREINEMKTMIADSSFEEAIVGFIKITELETPQSIRERRKANSLIVDLFKISVIERNGREKCIIPSTIGASDDDIEKVCQFHAFELYATYSEIYLLRYLHMLRNKFVFNEENLGFLVKQNGFVPEDRRRAFLKGIVAGFNMDYISAMSILMPQVENAIRRWAYEIGVATDKYDSEGGREYYSLSHLLDDPEMVDSIDEMLLFNLRVFYSSEYGFDMRNYVAHGLYSDEEFDSSSGLAVWWFTLRLCCQYSYELRKRLKSKSEEKNHNKE